MLAKGSLNPSFLL